MPSCRHCSQAFEITKDDLAFYEKVSPVFNGKKELIPPPTMCPTCRMMHLTCFRNEHSLHHNTCALTGKSIISLYSAQSGVTVYHNTAWWSDDWDALSYGKAYDPTQTFFAQFQALWIRVPKMSRIQQGESVNSDYTNACSNNKNCYLCFSANGNEDCYYSTLIDRCKDCIDCQTAVDCELCLEGVNIIDCYNCQYIQNCRNCIDSRLLKNCIGCTNCFGCINLQNVQYYIFNVQYSRDEYHAKVQEFDLTNSAILAEVQERVRALYHQHPHRSYQGSNNEDVSGDYITNSKHSYQCFDVDDIEDCKYCVGLRKGRDAYDVYHYGCTGDNQLLYMCEAVGHGAQNVLFSKLVWGGSTSMLYCYECFHSQDCFGCAGVKNARYCILNVQYTKEEYESLVSTIISRMRVDGEWGEFFPIRMSPFGYNETYAYDVAPVSENQAVSLGFHWTHDDKGVGTYMGPNTAIPQKLSEVQSDVTNHIFLCEGSGKPFKFLPQEVRYYQDQQLALPRFCPTERHRRRIQLRNPYFLWSRQCAKCQKDIQTTYAPERPEIVYCESCYLTTVY